MSRVLLVDDERALLAAIEPLLRSRGYEVVTARTAAAALAAAEHEAPDLVILDLGLPDLDGIEVCRRLRVASMLPIVVLSARGAETDKVAALDAGADDYVTKPFGNEELLARVRAGLRRAEAAGAPAGVLRRGDLTIDVDRRRVTRGDDELRLTPKEFELLMLLARNPGRVLTHQVILKAIWGPHFVNQPEHLRVLVNALRKKIERDTSHPAYILTDPWIGYRFADPD